MRSIKTILAAVLASLLGVAVVFATARSLAIDVCLDRGGRVSDRWLTCEFEHGRLVVIGDYFGFGPLLLVLASGVVTVYLTRRLLHRLFP